MVLNFSVFGLLVNTHAVHDDVCRMFYNTRLRKLSYERVLVMSMSIWQRHRLAHVSMFSAIARLYIRDQYKEENSAVPCHTLRYKNEVLGRDGVYCICMFSFSSSRPLRDTLISSCFSPCDS